jgi:hypothetical protein
MVFTEAALPPEFGFHVSSPVRWTGTGEDLGAGRASPGWGSLPSHPSAKLLTLTCHSQPALLATSAHLWDSGAVLWSQGPKALSSLLASPCHVLGSASQCTGPANPESNSLQIEERPRCQSQGVWAEKWFLRMPKS